MSDSESFVVFSSPPYSQDGKHTVFGRVVGGMDTLARMVGAASTAASPTGLSRCTPAHDASLASARGGFRCGGSSSLSPKLERERGFK